MRLGMPIMAGTPKAEAEAAKTSRPPAKKLGDTRGSVMSQKTRRGEAPLMRAASSRVLSICSRALATLRKASG